MAGWVTRLRQIAVARGPVAVAVAVSLLWLGLVVLFWLLAPAETAPRGALSRLMSLVGVVLPLVLIWMAAAAALTLAELRAEAERLRAEVARMRQGGGGAIDAVSQPVPIPPAAPGRDPAFGAGDTLGRGEGAPTPRRVGSARDADDHAADRAAEDGDSRHGAPAAPVSFMTDRPLAEGRGPDAQPAAGRRGTAAAPQPDRRSGDAAPSPPPSARFDDVAPGAGRVRNPAGGSAGAGDGRGGRPSTLRGANPAPRTSGPGQGARTGHAAGAGPRGAEAARATAGARSTRPGPAAQGSLALDLPGEGGLDAALFIRALNFPEGPDDAEGIAALRIALADPHTTRLIRAAQDVLTLLARDGVFMDDLAPEQPPVALWRQFAQGTRGAEIAALGGVRDRDVLRVVHETMRADTIFRDAAHHFLRQFDRALAAFEPEADDALVAALAASRTARAFMLLGRAAGTFD